MKSQILCKHLSETINYISDFLTRIPYHDSTPGQEHCYEIIKRPKGLGYTTERMPIPDEKAACLILDQIQTLIRKLEKKEALLDKAIETESLRKSL